MLIMLSMKIETIEIVLDKLLKSNGLDGTVAIDFFMVAWRLKF